MVRNKIKEDKCFSIKTNKDIFKDIKNTKKLQKKAYDYILNGNVNFKNAIDSINNGKIGFIRMSCDEYVYGKQSRILSQSDINNMGFYKHKMRLAPSIDDLIRHADIKYHSPLTHSNKIFLNGFNNFQGKLKIDNCYFRYIVRIGLTKNNESKFYDLNLKYLGKEKETKQIVPRIQEKSSLMKGLVPLTDNNISQFNRNVKPDISKYSMQNNKNNTIDLKLIDEEELKYIIGGCRIFFSKLVYI